MDLFNDFDLGTTDRFFDISTPNRVRQLNNILLEEGHTVIGNSDLDDLRLTDDNRPLSPELKEIRMDNMEDSNQNDTIPMNSVDRLMEREEVDVFGPVDPQYIFTDDVKSHNMVPLIQQSNQSFAAARDMLSIPPRKDQQGQGDLVLLERFKQGAKDFTQPEKERLRNLLGI